MPTPELTAKLKRVAPLQCLTLANVLAAMAEVDLIVRPWAPLIGLVELRETSYCDADSIYAIAGQPEFGTSDSVLCRSFDACLALVQRNEPKIASRGELAAYLFWAIHERRRRP